MPASPSAFVTEGQGDESSPHLAARPPWGWAEPQSAQHGEHFGQPSYLEADQQAIHASSRSHGVPPPVATSVVGLILALVSLVVAFVVGWQYMPLAPTLLAMTAALVGAMASAFLAGRAILHGARRVLDVGGLLAAGAAAALSVFFLLPMTDAAYREWYTCWYEAGTLEEANACDTAFNAPLFE